MISPIAAPTPEIAPKTPNALARSFTSVKVTVISESAAGASSAPNAPCRPRAANSVPRVGGDAAERGGAGEADQADEEGPLAADVVGDPAAEQQQATEGERVRGDDPLPVGVGDVAAPAGPTAWRYSRSWRRARP